MSGLHVAADVDEAVSIVEDGDTVLIGGFGIAGQPVELIEALIRSGASGLTVVNNNAGNGDEGLAALVKNGQVAKMICSFPRQSDSWHFDEAYRAGRLELEVVPQGTLAERIRAGGAGIGGFFTPTAYGTLLAEGKETRVIDGRGYVLEAPITGDVALVKALRSDATRWATSSIARPPATSGRPCAPRSPAAWCRSSSSSPQGRSTRRSS